MRNVCVIGGNRYFGRLLVRRLLDAGLDVTVLNRGSAPPPPGATHLVADRDDEAALLAALGDRTFDVVLDQVCSTPVQAAIARRVFAGRTGRYVMTSTIEVYDRSDASAPLAETDLDLAGYPVDPESPWGDAEFRAAHYAEGKRQAEAVFAGAPFDFVAVRSGHVLGAGDFTGRLAHYVDRVGAGEAVVVHAAPKPSSFISAEEIAAFLYWAAGATFTGAVNARSDGELDVYALAALLPGTPTFRIAGAGEEASPFSYGHYYGMDNSRAARLGFRFSDTADWLPGMVAARRAAETNREAAEAMRGVARDLAEGEGLTLAEIAEVLGVSRTRAQQLVS